ncbi:hypothetical protein HK405_013909, partial [Cladochytrium tenue]
ISTAFENYLYVTDGVVDGSPWLILKDLKPNFKQFSELVTSKADCKEKAIVAAKLVAEAQLRLVKKVGLVQDDTNYEN